MMVGIKSTRHIRATYGVPIVGDFAWGECSGKDSDLRSRQFTARGGGRSVGRGRAGAVARRGFGGAAATPAHDGIGRRPGGPSSVSDVVDSCWGLFQDTGISYALRCDAHLARAILSIPPDCRIRFDYAQSAYDTTSMQLLWSPLCLATRCRTESSPALHGSRAWGRTSAQPPSRVCKAFQIHRCTPSEIETRSAVVPCAHRQDSHTSATGPVFIASIGGGRA